MKDEQLKKRIYHAEILLKQIKSLAVVEDNLDNDAIVEMIDAYLNNTELRYGKKHAPLPIGDESKDARICACCTRSLPDDVDICFQCVGYNHFEPKYPNPHLKGEVGGLHKQGD